MKLRQAYKSGDAVVVALPRAMREALKIYPGTPVIISIRNQAIVIAKAVVSSEETAAAPMPEGGPARA